MTKPGDQIRQVAREQIPVGRRRQLVPPEPPPGCIARRPLTDRLVSADARLCLLKAAGGFGKTTLLAELSRVLARAGAATAWLQADDADDGRTLAAALVRALENAGVSLPEGGDSGAAADAIGASVSAHAQPCLLVLDEVERLADAGAIDLISALVAAAPPELRIAIACRELPVGLDLSGPVLAGEALTLDPDDLRFSKAEIAAYFDLRLSRQQLAAVTRESAGWPIALGRYPRDSQGWHTHSQARIFRDVLDNWFESQLWRRHSPRTREFLLDLGLFETIDPALVDEVLDTTGASRRLNALNDMAGLIVGGDTEDRRFHPILREYCSRRRLRETPDRFRAVHGRCALALERRGDTIAAVRHAAEAEQPALVGRLLEAAGGLRFLWILKGPMPLSALMPYLTQKVVEERPRLALARCAAHIFEGQIPEARRDLELAAAHSDGFTRNPAGDDRELVIDHCIVQGFFYVASATPFDSSHLREAEVAVARFAADDTLSAATRAALQFSLALVDIAKARFDTGLARAERARQFAGDGRAPYLSMHLHYQFGIAAMVQGRVDHAAAAYRRGLRIARTDYPANPTTLLIGEALLRELELERNRLSGAVGSGLRTRDSFSRPGNTMATHFAEAAIVCELTQHALGVNVALDVLTEMDEYARGTDRPALAAYLAALRTSMLAGDGQGDAAERTWRTDGLPTEPGDLLDPGRHSWRMMEALAIARLHLLTALGDFGSARELARRLVATTESLGARRTTMRALAAWMALEHRAGDERAADRHLASFLRLYASTDYARPIARIGVAGSAALARLLASEPDPALHGTATQLQEVLGHVSGRREAISNFTERERAVLSRLDGHRDKDIAADLGISPDGVRYHVRRLFAKLGARNRHDAVRRARTVGLLPDT